jgi:hypothetical protein
MAVEGSPGEAKLLESLKKVLLRELGETHFQLVTCAVLVLQVLTRAYATELSSSDHYSHLCRKGFCFLHGMSSQYDRCLAPLLSDLRDNRPQEPSGLRVHAGGRLI